MENLIEALMFGVIFIIALIIAYRIVFRKKEVSRQIKTNKKFWDMPEKVARAKDFIEQNEESIRIYQEASKVRENAIVRIINCMQKLNKASQSNNKILKRVKHNNNVETKVLVDLGETQLKVNEAVSKMSENLQKKRRNW